MNHYTKQTEQHNKLEPNLVESAIDRYALRLSRQLGFPVAHVRTVLLANAAVKER